MFVKNAIKNRGKKKRYTFPFYVSILAGVLLFVALAGGSFSKYYYQAASEGSVRAEQFYFSSDLLDEETHILAPGTKSLTFTLGNHADQLRYSEVEITYTVELTGQDGKTIAANISSSEPNSQEIRNGQDGILTGTLQPGAVTDAAVTLDVSQLSAGTYTIKATGTNGYSETLSANITILSDEPRVYKYLDTSNSEYVLLTVWTENYTGDVTVAFPNGLLPDNTDSVMRSVTTQCFTDRQSFQEGGYTSHIYRFFGSGSTVTANDFTVEYSIGEGTQQTAGIGTLN